MRIPHPIPYQGSKRRLANAILGLSPKSVRTLYEPFAGSAAMALAAAARGIATEYIISDRLEPLCLLWKRIINEPSQAADEYEQVWSAQLDDPRAHYLTVREEFNRAQDPILLLYLMARCVKNAIRFNPKGEFNQSADHRRNGMRPEKMRKEILGAASLLNGKAHAHASDYREAIKNAGAEDLVYMDPPYQGVSKSRDPRYVAQLDYAGFVSTLFDLNERGVRFIISFDGYCGNKQYGESLPEELGLKQILIDAGRSSQATLNGKDDRTIESIYLSPGLSNIDQPERLSVSSADKQVALAI